MGGQTRLMGGQMKRREFITFLGGAAAALPLAARTQQAGPMRRVGILMPYPEADAQYQKYVRALREELARLGWTAGSNVQFDERWTTDNMDRVRGGAVQLLDLKPDVIVVWSHRATSVLHQQASPIPVYSSGLAIRSKPAWSPALQSQEVVSPVSRSWKTRSSARCWNC